VNHILVRDIFVETFVDSEAGLMRDPIKPADRHQENGMKVKVKNYERLGARIGNIRVNWRRKMSKSSYDHGVYKNIQMQIYFIP